MDQRQIVVETGLDEEIVYNNQSYRKHAKARFVAMQPPLDQSKPPTLGDPWCPLTVRARLHRVNWVLTKDPKVGPREPASCMPEHVREIFKDLPGEPMRIPVPAADNSAVNQTLTTLVRYRDVEDRAVIWALAAKRNDSELARDIHTSDKTARTRKQAMLKRLAEDWNGRGWMPDLIDIERAESFLHRNVK